MAISARALLRKWFGRGKYPTAEQFASLFDSFLHKEEDRLDIGQIDGLAEQLNGKLAAADGERLDQTAGQAARQAGEALEGLGNVRKTLDDKVDKITGKGLSTEDFTPQHRMKLEALTPGGSGAGVVVQHAEQIVGEWVDPKYADRMPLYERIFTIDLSTHSGVEGEYVTVVLDPELRIEKGSYLRVVDAYCLSGGIYYPMPGLVHYIVQEGGQLTADIVLPVQAEGELSIQLRYVKMQGDVVTFELKVPAATSLTSASIAFPPLKYFKHVAFTPCFDDSNVTAWCNVLAFINRRRVYTTDRGNNSEDYKYFHKAWKPSPSDTFVLYPEPLDFDNGTGRRIRYAFSCAIWGGRPDSSEGLHNPYICWDELRDILDYGGSILYHDVETELFDVNDPASIREGFAYLRAQTKEKLGVLPKILGQPNADVDYITAAMGTPLVQFMRQGAPDDNRLIHTNRVYDLYHDHTRGGRTAAQQIAPKIEEIAEQMASDDPYWISFTRHEASRHGDDYQLYKTLYDTYSKNADTDRLWVASWDAVYEWMYLRCHGEVGIDTAAARIEGDYAYIPCRLIAPRKEAFLYRDASILVDLHATPASCEVVNCSANVVRAESAVDGTQVRINLNYDPQSAELAEKYTAIFEATADELDREAARYFAGWLSDALAAPFRERIDAVRVVPIEGLQIEGPQTLAEGALGTFTVTAAPSDTTQMARIDIRLSEGLALLSRRTDGNALTVVCRAAAQGAQMLTAVCGEVAAEHAVEVGEAPADVPITQITIEGPATCPINANRVFTIEALPADNTQMEQITLEPSDGLTILSSLTEGNRLTVNCQGKTAGSQRLVATCREVSASHTVEIYTPQIEEVPITQITIAGDDTIVGSDAVKTYTITCLPADNTQMQQVALLTTGGVAIEQKSVAGNIGTVELRATANGAAALQASVGSIRAEKQITVSGITAPVYRIIASFGWDFKVATGGVYDPDGGYTKITLTKSVPGGTLYLTDGTVAGAYTYTSADIPKGAGVANRGPATGDDSGLYKDYAIQSYIYAGLSNEYAMQLDFAGLTPGRYKVRFYLNVGNVAYSRGAVAGFYKLTTSAGEYPIVMPADNRDVFYQNHNTTIDTEVTVGSDGALRFDMASDTENKDNLVSLQILDIEKLS